MRPYTIAVALFLVVIVAAHVVAPEAYSWTEHTMSHLGAQGYENATIMRLGLIAYGALVLLAAIWKVWRFPRRAWPNMFIGIYGFAILLTGFFSTSPFQPDVPYSIAEANLHSNLASVAGFAISAAMAAFALTAGARRPRIVHAVALVLTMLVSATFFATGGLDGAFQRLLWLVGFAWLVLLETPWLAEPTPPA